MFKRLQKTSDSKLCAHQSPRSATQADGDGCLRMAPDISKDATTTGAARRLTPVIGTPTTQRSGRQLHITDQHQHFASILTRHMERAFGYEEYESTVDDEESRPISARSSARSSLVSQDGAHAGLVGRARVADDPPSPAPPAAAHAAPAVRRGSLAASAWRVRNSGDAAITDPREEETEPDNKDAGAERPAPALPTIGTPTPRDHGGLGGAAAARLASTYLPLPGTEIITGASSSKGHSSHTSTHTSTPVPKPATTSPRRGSDQSLHSQSSGATAFSASSVAALVAMHTSSSNRSSMGSTNIPFDSPGTCNVGGRAGAGGGQSAQKLLASVTAGYRSPIPRRPATDESCVGALSMIGSLRRQDPAYLQERSNARQRCPNKKQAVQQNLRPMVAWTMK